MKKRKRKREKESNYKTPLVHRSELFELPLLRGRLHSLRHSFPTNDTIQDTESACWEGVENFCGRAQSSETEP